MIVVFDCDGVLLDSNRLKIEIFAETLRAAGFSEVDATAFGRHVAANFGTSRYKLFEQFLARADLVRRPDVTVAELAESYGARLYDQYVRCAATPGMNELLDALKARGIVMLVVSGSDQSELRRLMAERGLAAYFAAVYGSPTSKTQHLEAIAAEYGLSQAPRDLVFVGDAEADLKAAEAVGARFIYMDSFSTAQAKMRALRDEKGFESISDLTSLQPVLQTA